MSELVVVFVTVGSSEEAGNIAERLVQEKLAACVNRVGAMESIYWWEGKLCRETEELLIIKTRRDLFSALERRVKELHSYETPEVIALPIVDGSAPYLAWVVRNTRQKEERTS